MWKCLWVHNNFPVILLENDVENGGGGGVEAPVERMRVERTVWENEKKKKRKGVKWMSRPREKMVSVKMSGGE